MCVCCKTTDDRNESITYDNIESNAKNGGTIVIPRGFYWWWCKVLSEYVLTKGSFKDIANSFKDIANSRLSKSMNDELCKKEQQ